MPTLEKQAYFPFMSARDVYEHDDEGLTFNRVLQAFSAFKIPSAAISTDFKLYLNRLIRDNFPDLRCSVARAIIEGRIPGVPIPAAHIHIGWRHRVRQMLYLLDIFETIAYLHVEKQIKEQSPTVRNQIKGVTKVMGGVKVPRLMETVFQLEELEDAEQDAKTKTGNGRRSPRKGKTGNPKKSSQGVS